MKANELRIGNDINIGGSTIDTYQTFKPTKVTINILKAIIEENIDRPDAILSMFQPIPLTEEWLVKLGFDGYSKYILGGGRIRIKFVRNGTRTQTSFKNVAIPRQIKYVHQLQNLYFALTGEELVCLL